MGFVARFHLLTILFFGAIWICIAAFLWLRKGKGFVYLAVFTVAYVYLFEVLDYTLFQFQSLLILRHITPGLIVRGQEVGASMNLVPLITLTRHDLKTSFLNVLLLMPFGFGLPAITTLRMESVVAIGALVSIAIELLQLTTGLIAGMTFRVADVNDVIFNTVGVAIGYALFVGLRPVSAWRASNKEPR
jgi:glycopeptide antibiotics resistance protein